MFPLSLSICSLPLFVPPLFQGDRPAPRPSEVERGRGESVPSVGVQVERLDEGRAEGLSEDETQETYLIWRGGESKGTSAGWSVRRLASETQRSETQRNEN